jgi:hypothetical protein
MIHLKIHCIEVKSSTPVERGWSGANEQTPYN